MNLISIREILEKPDNIPEGWLFLPKESDQWNLDTKGILHVEDLNLSPEEMEDSQPKEEDGWVEFLDNNIMEEVIFNAGEYEGDRTSEELLQAFIFYYENDAFMEFEE